MSKAFNRSERMTKISIGFHGDLNATYPVGEISEDSQRLIRTTREALDAAIAICKPGALFRDLGNAMYVTHRADSCGVPRGLFPPNSEPIAKANGCSVVRQYTGHGCNQLVQSLSCM